MKTDKYKEREKYWRSLDRRLHELADIQKDKIYIPLEKPQFAGWEIYVDIKPDLKLSEQTMIYLNFITDLLKLRIPKFHKKVKTIKAIRLLKYEFSRVLETSFIHGALSHLKANIPGQYPRWMIITEKQYMGLPEHYKHYFVRDSYARNARIEYRLHTWRTKWDPLDVYIVKVKKAYHTMRRIPNGEAESEDKKIYSYLRDKVHYWGSSYGWKLSKNKPLRIRWNAALNRLKRVRDHFDYWDDIVEPQNDYDWELWDIPRVSYSDIEENILKGHKVYDKVKS